MINKNLGIQNYGPWYFFVKENQNSSEEMFKKHMFLAKFISANYSNFKELTFINYGSYELVYVLTLDDDKKYTIIINQPNLEYGLVKKEFDNLTKLAVDSNILKPIKYCTDGENELYVTRYVEQARCIGVETTKWGVWVPEPYYHFREFDERETSIVTRSLVSMLINYYDEENELGLSKIRLDGGDFMLDKGYEDEITQSNILKKIRLIAARDMVNMRLDEYIKTLMDELTTSTDSKKIVGKRLRKTLNKTDVADGILLGLK